MTFWFFASALRCGRRHKIISSCTWNGLDMSCHVPSLDLVVEADAYLGVKSVVFLIEADNSGSLSTPAAGTGISHQDSAPR